MDRDNDLIVSVYGGETQFGYSRRYPRQKGQTATGFIVNVTRDLQIQYLRNAPNVRADPGRVPVEEYKPSDDTIQEAGHPLLARIFFEIATAFYATWEEHQVWAPVVLLSHDQRTLILRHVAPGNAAFLHGRDGGPDLVYGTPIMYASPEWNTIPGLLDLRHAGNPKMVREALYVAPRPQDREVS